MSFLPAITQLGKNAYQDAVDLGTGFLNLGKDAYQYGQSRAKQGKTTTPTDVIANYAPKLAKGTTDEYANLAGHGDPNAALQHAYQHPLNTALDVLPAMGALKGAKAAATTAKAGEGAELVSDLTKPKTAAPTLQGATTRTMTPPPVSDVAANTYLKAYTIPTKLKIDPVATAKWMIHDQPNVKNIDGFMNSVEKIKRDVLGKATDAGAQVNAIDSVQHGVDALDRIPQLKDTPGKLAGYQQELRAMVPGPQSDAAGNIGGITPLDTYDAIHQIEEQGYAYHNAARDYVGTVSNVELDKVSRAYLDTARELEATLDKKLAGTGTMAQYTQNPTLVEAFRSFSPKVAERFQNNVKDWSDLRALQKPYVDMGKIIDYTNKAGHTAFANLSGGATRAIGSGVGAGVGSLFGPLGSMTGATVGSLAEPFVAAGANKLMPPVTSAIANNVGKLSAGVGAVGAGAKAFARGAPAVIGATGDNAMSSPVAMDVQGNEQNKQSNNHGATIPEPSSSVNSFSKIPQTVAEIQPDQHGNFPVLNPYTFKGEDGASLAVSDADYQAQKAALNQQKQSNQYVADPFYRNQIDQAENALDTKYTVSQKLGAGYQAATNLNAKLQDARSILNDPGTPSTLLQQFGSFDALAKASNGKYRQLAQDLQFIEKNYAGEGSLLQPQTKEVANAALLKVNQNMLNDFYSRLLNFTGGNTQPAAGNQSGTSQLPPITAQQQTQQPSGLLPAPKIPGMAL